MVEANHHANFFLRRGIFTHHFAQGTFQTTAELDGFFLLQLLQSSRDILVVQIRRVLECIQGLFKFRGRRKPGNVVYPRHRSNEVTISNISQSGKMCLVPSGIRDMPSRADKATDLLIFGTRDT